MALPAPYRSSADRDLALERTTEALGGEVHQLGASREGRPMRVARIPSTSSNARPVLLCAGIHGLEYIGVEVALGFLQALNSDALGPLRERAEVWVLPSLNPDAYERTWQSDGKGTLKQLRCNAAGVDLNRNFPLPAPLAPVLSTLQGWRTGSDDPNNSFYRGTGPLSEPETAALEGLLARVPFTAGANLHSTMGTLITPCVLKAETHAQYRALHRAFAGAQPRSHYKRITGGSLDRFTGEQEDHQHHAHHCWAVCIEHYPVWVDMTRVFSSALFPRYNPPDPGPWIANDVPGLCAYFLAALDLPPPVVEVG